MDPEEIAELTRLRRALHRRPELSGQERETAALLRAHLAATRPARILEGLGGHGLAFVYEGPEPGPSALFRCELDALPIPERGEAPWRSESPGLGHMCGHDGHMAILAGLARWLGRNPLRAGRAILLFQPAEETGAGARAVVADPRWPSIRPDFAFALHNIPGLPRGLAGLTTGPVHCASQGLIARFEGRTSHAAWPEQGLSPAAAAARLVLEAPALGPGGPLDEAFRLLTLTHARIGEPSFGVAPGLAEVFMTLRALTDAGMAELKARVLALARGLAEAQGLAVSFSDHDVFDACANHPAAADLFSEALRRAGFRIADFGPVKPSEDFGVFGAHCAAAMLHVGAGEGIAPLHSPDYDFPDGLLAECLPIFVGLLTGPLGMAETHADVSGGRAGLT